MIVLGPFYSPAAIQQPVDDLIDRQKGPDEHCTLRGKLSASPYSRGRSGERLLGRAILSMLRRYASR